MRQRFYWYEPVNYFAQQLATHINNGWYDCWQFKTDFKESWLEKKNQFVDGADVYLSFMFNLLGNSWQLKIAGENLSKAQQQHDMVTFWQELGYILQLCYQFESYKTVASPLTYIRDAAVTSDTELKGETKQERYERRLSKARADGLEYRKRKEALEAEHPTLARGKGYKWSLGDFIFAPFAFVVGGLNSLGDTSSGSFCSRYILSSR